ncbi:hypothetical protein LZ31DRAFT_186482 [Colletotrichum somersetense]|nr:hypothetical protein LZ31DRAFT_186482 [Colletotrichum somersetense]
MAGSCSILKRTDERSRVFSTSVVKRLPGTSRVFRCRPSWRCVLTSIQMRVWNTNPECVSGPFSQKKQVKGSKAMHELHCNARHKDTLLDPGAAGKPKYPAVFLALAIVKAVFAGFQSFWIRISLFPPLVYVAKLIFWVDNIQFLHAFHHFLISLLLVSEHHAGIFYAQYSYVHLKLQLSFPPARVSRGYSSRPPGH